MEIVAKLIMNARGFTHVAVQISVKAKIERGWTRERWGSRDRSEIHVRVPLKEDMRIQMEEINKKEGKENARERERGGKNDGEHVHAYVRAEGRSERRTVIGR